MQGTRGPNFQDWSGNLIYGWDKWTNAQQGGTQLIASLVGLTTQTNAGNIHFTGQSLGGALAEYALYDFALARNEANRADPTIAVFDPTKVTLTTFNGLGGIEALQKDLPRNFNANAGIVSAVDTTHFWITNDLVHRLGGGHLNGAENEYELKFYKTDTAGNILRRSDGKAIYMDAATEGAQGQVFRYRTRQATAAATPRLRAFNHRLGLRRHNIAAGLPFPVS